MTKIERQKTMRRILDETGDVLAGNWDEYRSKLCQSKKIVHMTETPFNRYYIIAPLKTEENYTVYFASQ